MLSTLSSSFAFSGPNSGPNVEYLAEFAKVREARPLRCKISLRTRPRTPCKI